MAWRPLLSVVLPCHPPCGGCGLKYVGRGHGADLLGHPPCGGCGLKSVVLLGVAGEHGHPPCGGCGLKLEHRQRRRGLRRSPSVWRVWIEIPSWGAWRHSSGVTLRVEGVD